MPRKDFIRDLKEAQSGALPQNVISLQPGQDDGTFTLLFQCSDSHQIQIHAQVSDVGDYPRSHSFFIFTDSEDVPQDMHSALGEISVLSETIVSQTITQITTTLNQAIGVFTPEDDDDDVIPEEEDSEDVYQSDEFMMEEEEAGFHVDDGTEVADPTKIASRSRLAVLPLVLDENAFTDQVRQDLLMLKQAGFRISYQGRIFVPGVSCLLMVSIRVAKLGLPDDTLEAWSLHPSDYIMLLLKYKLGYCSLQMLRSSSMSRDSLHMHILVTKKYKLTAAEVLQATETQKNRGNDSEVTEKVHDLSETIRPLFMGTALEELLNSRLLALIRFRLDFKLDWAGAMGLYNAKQGEIRIIDVDVAQFALEEDISKIQNLPKYIQVDPLQDASVNDLGKLSFPWIAMQFTLRQIVRCTEFCLVCFDKTNDDFEALKPYVCSRPLCLYQYMAMGLGPGIEFEVLSQKYVVDLLISFCYHGATFSGLRSLPIGLGLMVPDPGLLPKTITLPQYSYQQTNITSASNVKITREFVIAARWIPRHQEIVLESVSKEDSSATTFKAGDWLMFCTPERRVYHCQLSEKFHPTYRYKNFIRSNGKMIQTMQELQNNQDIKSLEDDPNLRHIDIEIVPYTTLFDSLDNNGRHAAVRMLLDTLPSVNEMAEYLNATQGLHGQLSGWTERIIPSASTLLRWVIASNRSCIVYNETPSLDEVVHGMSGYLQFRFASGAPDKESRFIKSVDEVHGRLKQQYPTIFAWHGSPLKNWHSIVREGLNFDQIVNGRAYGNGIYHALDAQTSLGYARMDAIQSWPSSILGVQQVLSLNEIVNAPLEFQSRQPYLVVQHNHWVQTRYLFVKCSKSEVTEVWQLGLKPSLIMAQDSTYVPLDDKRTAITIPACAISRSRRQAQAQAQAQASAQHTARKVNQTIIGWINSASMGDEFDAQNGLSYEYDSESSNDGLSQSRQKKNHSPPLNVTPFKQGRLDRERLPMLASPTYATSASTRALHRELQGMLTEQLETPSAELGWYLDPDHVENVYHWIIELHSFDKDIPLAKDMLEQKVESIVLEIRFGPNFNFSPPFIRVVEPRFLPFAQGGGGHVTAGGAICMELLTSNGWNPSSTMSAVLLQVRMALTSLDPKPARLERRGGTTTYSPGEAADAYRRACQMHGWTIPDDFRSIIAMTEVIKPVVTQQPALTHQPDGESLSNPLVIDDDDDNDMDGGFSLTKQPDLKKQRRA